MPVMKKSIRIYVVCPVRALSCAHNINILCPYGGTVVQYVDAAI